MDEVGGGGRWREENSFKKYGEGLVARARWLRRKGAGEPGAWPKHQGSGVICRERKSLVGVAKKQRGRLWFRIKITLGFLFHRSQGQSHASSNALTAWDSPKESSRFAWMWRFSIRQLNEIASWGLGVWAPILQPKATGGFCLRHLRQLNKAPLLSVRLELCVQDRTHPRMEPIPSLGEGKAFRLERFGTRVGRWQCW